MANFISYVIAGCPIAPLLLQHEVSVAFCACNNDIHPDPHGFWRRSNHVVDAVMGLNTESQQWVGTLE